MASRTSPLALRSTTLPPLLTNAGQVSMPIDTSFPQTNAALSDSRWATSVVPTGQQPAIKGRKLPFHSKVHPSELTQVSPVSMAFTATYSASGAPSGGVGSGCMAVSTHWPQPMLGNSVHHTPKNKAGRERTPGVGGVSRTTNHTCVLIIPQPLNFAAVPVAAHNSRSCACQLHRRPHNFRPNTPSCHLLPTDEQ